MSITVFDKISFDCIQHMTNDIDCRRYELDLNFNFGIDEIISAFKEIAKNGYFDGYKLSKEHVPILTINHFAISQPMPFMTIDFNEEVITSPKFLNDVMRGVTEISGLYAEGILWTEVVPMKHENTLSLSSWRKRIIKDDSVCAACGGTKHLEAHHVFSQADYPEFSGHPMNGVPLCKFCHKKYHSYYPGEANVGNLIEFLKRFGDLK